MKKLRLPKLIRTVFVSLIVYSVFLGVVSCGKSDNITVENIFANKKNLSLEVIRVKGEMQNDMYSSSLVDVTLIETKEDSYTINWKYGKTSLKGSKPQQLTPEQEAILNIYQNFSMDLIFSPQGQVDILNFDKVYPQVEDMFFTLYQVDKQDEQSEMYQQLKQMFKMGAATPQSFLTNYFPEIPQFFKVLGKTYTIGEFSKTDSIESPSGSGYLYLSSVVEWEELDGVTEVLVEEKVNPDEVKSLYLNYLKEMQQEQEIDESKIPPFNYSKITTLQLDENNQIIENKNQLKLDNGMEKMESSTVIKILN